MQRRDDAPRRSTLWLERLAWNAAAVAALAVMLLVLLSSLRWLDELAPQTANDLAPVSAPQIARELPESRPTEVARVNRPSG
jgi:hypothetical protein